MCRSDPPHRRQAAVQHCMTESVQYLQLGSLRWSGQLEAVPASLSLLTCLQAECNCSRAVLKESPCNKNVKSLAAVYVASVQAPAAVLYLKPYNNSLKPYNNSRHSRYVPKLETHEPCHHSCGLLTNAGHTQTVLPSQ